MGKRKNPARKKNPKAVKTESAGDESSFLSRNKREALVLAILPVLLYLSSVSFGFVLDDKIVIEENQFVREGIGGIGKILATETLAGFIGEEQNVVAGSRYRPLSLVSFAIENGLYGLNPAMSHLINVLLYGITCLVLFRVFSIFTSENSESPWYFRLPFVAALFFALHPLHSEVVANIKGRDEMLALLFSLTALLLTLRYLRSKKPMSLFLSGLVFLLALLAKENSITFLAIVPLSIFVFSNEKARSISIAMAPLVASTAIFLILRHHATGNFLLGSGEEVTELMNNPFVAASTAEKYATIFYTWGLYLKLLFFPHPLTHDYYPYHVPLVGFADLRAIIPVVLYLAMAAFAVLKFRKGNIVSWSILFFLATFSVVSNLFFPIGTFMNERFMYMPSVGFCLFLAWILTRRLPVWLEARPSLSRVVPVGIAVAFALGFSLKTFARVPDWESDMSLNRAGARISTGSARINCYMGYSLYGVALGERDEARKQELLDEAAFYLDRSLKIYPSYRDALNVYAGVLSSRYLLDGEIDPLLDGFFRILTKNKPPHVDEFLYWLNEQGRHQEELADFYLRAGNEYYFKTLKNDAEAEKYLEFGYHVAPDNLSILEALGDFWLARGSAGNTLKARRDAYEVLKYAGEGIEFDPTHGKFYEMAAAAYEKLGEPAKANLMRQQASQLNSP
jgi:tetratricopeptide (TPR) repeat protein